MQSQSDQTLLSTPATSAKSNSDMTSQVQKAWSRSLYMPHPPIEIIQWDAEPARKHELVSKTGSQISLSFSPSAVGFAVIPCVELSLNGKTKTLPLPLGLAAREYKLSADSFSVDPASHKLTLNVPGHLSINWDLDARLELSENSGYSRYISMALGNRNTSVHLREGAKREIGIQATRSSRSAAGYLDSILKQLSQIPGEGATQSPKTENTASVLQPKVTDLQASFDQTRATSRAARIKTKQKAFSDAMTRVSGLTEETDFRQVMTGLGIAQSMISNGDMNRPAGQFEAGQLTDLAIDVEGELGELESLQACADFDKDPELYTLEARQTKLAWKLATTATNQVGQSCVLKNVLPRVARYKSLVKDASVFHLYGKGGQSESHFGALKKDWGTRLYRSAMGSEPEPVSELDTASVVGEGPEITIVPSADMSYETGA